MKRAIFKRETFMKIGSLASKILLAGAFCLALFNTVACSDDSSSTTSAKTSKNVQVESDSLWKANIVEIDSKKELPSCDSSESTVAQVYDEKAFFVCKNGEWQKVSIVVPSYDDLPQCGASLNDFCIDIAEDAEIQDSFVCDEGKWVKGFKDDEMVDCTKEDENYIPPPW